LAVLLHADVQRSIEPGQQRWIGGPPGDRFRSELDVERAGYVMAHGDSGVRRIGEVCGKRKIDACRRSKADAKLLHGAIARMDMTERHSPLLSVNYGGLHPAGQ